VAGRVGRRDEATHLSQTQRLSHARRQPPLFLSEVHCSLWWECRSWWLVVDGRRWWCDAGCKRDPGSRQKALGLGKSGGRWTVVFLGTDLLRCEFKGVFL
jgi:hypothetical protein